MNTKKKHRRFFSVAPWLLLSAAFLLLPVLKSGESASAETPDANLNNQPVVNGVVQGKADFGTYGAPGNKDTLEVDTNTPVTVGTVNELQGNDTRRTPLHPVPPKNVGSAVQVANLLGRDCLECLFTVNGAFNPNQSGGGVGGTAPTWLARYNKGVPRVVLAVSSPINFGEPGGTLTVTLIGANPEVSYAVRLDTNTTGNGDVNFEPQSPITVAGAGPTVVQLAGTSVGGVTINGHCNGFADGSINATVNAPTLNVRTTANSSTTDPGPLVQIPADVVQIATATIRPGVPVPTMTYSVNTSVKFKGTKSGNYGVPPVMPVIRVSPNSPNASSIFNITGLFDSPGYYDIQISGSATYTPNRGGPFTAVCAYPNPVDVYITVFRVDLTNNGADITGQNPTVLVGDLESMTVRVDPNDLSPAYSWTVPGNRVSDFQVAANSSTGHMVPLTNLTAQAVSFHWIRGGNPMTVKAVVTLSGKSVTVSAGFNVIAPTFSNVNAQLCDVTHVDYKRIADFGGNAAIYIGGWGNGAPPNIPGYPFAGYVGLWGHAEFVVPAPFAGVGVVRWVQVFYLHDLYKHTDGGLYKGDLVLGLDNSYPYVDDDDFDDSPGVGLPDGPGSNEYDDSTGFYVYLMYNSQRANAIPVPIRFWDWGYGGDAVHPPAPNQSQWVANPGTLFQSRDSLWPGDKFPDWNQLSTNGAVTWILQP